MGIYLIFSNRKKRKCIFWTAFIISAACILFNQSMFDTSWQRKELLFMRYETFKMMVQKNAEKREGIFDGKQNNGHQNSSLYHSIKVANNTKKSKSTRPEDKKQKQFDNNRKDEGSMGKLDESKVVFFLGGGKSGSTTLATYLKHDPENWKLWDRNGQFLDGGKEFCWAMSSRSKEQFWKHFKSHGSKMAIFALDACPRAVDKTHFIRMVTNFPNASYLMLVRDPVDRVISHLNDKMDRGGAIGGIIEQFLKGKISGDLSRLSMFGTILQNAYSVLPKDRILIIPTTDLTKQPQETIDRVLKHIGAKPKNVTLLQANKRKHWKTYQIPSNVTIKWLRNMFYKDWEIFKNLSGIHVDTVYM